MAEGTTSGGGQVIGWQPGIDWEVYSRQQPMRADAFDQDVLVAVVHARWRWLLFARMTWQHWRLKRHGMGA